MRSNEETRIKDNTYSITYNKYFPFTTVLFSKLFSRCGKEVLIKFEDKLEERVLRVQKSVVANLCLEFRYKFYDFDHYY